MTTLYFFTGPFSHMETLLLPEPRIGAHEKQPRAQAPIQKPQALRPRASPLFSASVQMARMPKHGTSTMVVPDRCMSMPCRLSCLSKLKPDRQELALLSATLLAQQPFRTQRKPRVAVR